MIAAIAAIGPAPSPTGRSPPGPLRCLIGARASAWSVSPSRRRSGWSRSRARSWPASVGAFQAVNWALLSDDVPRARRATAFGLANVATAGAGALSGVFGILVDVLNEHARRRYLADHLLVGGPDRGLGVIPLRRISPKDADA